MIVNRSQVVKKNSLQRMQSIYYYILMNRKKIRLFRFLGNICLAIDTIYNCLLRLKEINATTFEVVTLSHIYKLHICMYCSYGYCL